jgi:hypothetical protein
MDHRLVHAIQDALGWDGPRPLGQHFGFGHMPDPGLADQLLNPAKLLDIILRHSLTYPQLRCLYNGQDLHPRDYFTITVTGRGQAIQVADMRRIGNYLKHGCTLVLDDLGPLDAVMEVACRALSWWAGEFTRVNTYLTTQDASGWGLHWDSHDVICIQLAGEKNWEVRGPSRPAPMERDIQPNTEPSTEIVWSGIMRAGDVMHIPRGWWHQATRTGNGPGFSLHATFGLTQRTGADWLTWIADQARAHELFRHDLNQHADPDQQRKLTTAATQLLTEHGPADYFATRQQQRPSARHVTTLGAFGPPDTVVCVTDFPPSLETRDGKTTILAAGKKITVQATTMPALRLLLNGNPANIKDITTATGVDAAALAKVLIEQDICAELTPDLARGHTSGDTVRDG